MKNSYALDSKEAVSYNGKKFYLRIRAANEGNPVVLFLHGGCGSPDRAQMIKYQSPLAENFTLVAWDQSGSGLAYDKTKAKDKNFSISKEDIVEDAYDVVQYLKQRFSKEKIIVVGHSWGSVLGVWLARRCPEDIAAYVGVGQCIDYIKNEEMSYLWTLEEAKRVGNKRSVKTLLDIGYPENGVYKGNHTSSLIKQRSVLHKLGGATYKNRKPYWRELLENEVPLVIKEYGLCGAVRYVKGISYSLAQPMANTNPDFLNTVKSLEVPVYLLLGRHDLNCVFALAEEWFNALDAPEKRLIWFENSAHSPQWEEPEAWNRAFCELFLK